MPVTPNSAPPLVDAVASVPSLRTLGTGAQQAASGDDSRFYTPINAQVTPAPNKVPISNGSGAIAEGWFPNSGVIAGTYNNITVDAKGIVTSGTISDFGTYVFADTRRFTSTIGTEEVIAQYVVDFSDVHTDSLQARIAALASSSGGLATFKVRVGGTDSVADGTVVATASTTSGTTVAITGTGTTSVPIGVQYVKLTAISSEVGLIATIADFSVSFFPSSVNGHWFAPDSDEYASSTGTEEVASQYVVDFADFTYSELAAKLTASVSSVSGTATIRIRIGGTDSVANGYVVAEGTVTTSSPALFLAAGLFTNPGALQFLKITIESSGAGINATMDHSCAFISPKSTSTAVTPPPPSPLSCDPTKEYSVISTSEELLFQWLVDFNNFTQSLMNMELSAFAKVASGNGIVRLYLGGNPDTLDGILVGSSSPFRSPTYGIIEASGNFTRPAGKQCVKVTMQNSVLNSAATVEATTVIFRSAV